MISRDKLFGPGIQASREGIEAASSRVPSIFAHTVIENSNSTSDSRSSETEDGLKETVLAPQQYTHLAYRTNSEPRPSGRVGDHRAGLVSETSDSSTNGHVESPPFNYSHVRGSYSAHRQSTSSHHSGHRDGCYRIPNGEDYDDFWEPTAPIHVPPDHTQPVEWCAFSPESRASSVTITDELHSSPDYSSQRRVSIPIAPIHHSDRGSRCDKSFSSRAATGSGIAPGATMYDNSNANAVPVPMRSALEVEEEEEFGEDTEHIDFSALKGRLHVFCPGPDVDVTDSRGKYVFYSLRTGLLRHHILAEIGKRHGVGVKSLSEVMRSGPFWLDICDPTMEELRALCEIFKMHPLTLEGLESEGEDIREKCDVFEKYYFVCIRAFDADANSDYYMRPITLFMLVSPSCVVTIHRDPLEFSHTIAKRMRLLTARTGLTSDWIVYTILEDVLEMFVPSFRATELEIDAIDDSVEVSSKRSSSNVDASSPRQVQTQAELFGRIASARKQVTQLIRLMSAKSELLRVIAKRCGTRFSDDALLYLRDLQDHTAMVDQTLHHYDESLNRSHANYLAHINLEISETSNKMSDIMKKLTAISTVTLPWSMITGLMGMNVFVPGGKSYYTESWLPWLCLFIAMSSLSVLIYGIGRRRDWF